MKTMLYRKDLQIKEKHIPKEAILGGPTVNGSGAKPMNK